MDDIQIRLHRNILPVGDEGPSTSNSSRSKSAPPARDKIQLQQGNLPGNLGRTQGRTLRLAPEWQPPDLAPDQLSLDEESVPWQFRGPGQRVRVRCYCIGEAFDRLHLQEQILKRSRNTYVRAFAEVLCSVYSNTQDGTKADNNILYFDFGCVVFWGLPTETEQYVLKEIALPCLKRQTLQPKDWERDQMVVHYTQRMKTLMENDVLGMHYRHAEELDIKLALSFALAQSTKLSYFEEQMRRMGRHLMYLPKTMAEAGDVHVSEKELMMHTGELYKFMSEVNLLGQILDMPDTLFETQTTIKSLYKSIFDYLELEDRIDLINDRFAVLSEMLSILRTHVAQSKFAHLEAIIMWLVGVCVVLAVFQLIGFLGWTPEWRDATEI